VNFLTASPFNLSGAAGAGSKIVFAVDGTNYDVTLGNGAAVTGNTILGAFNTALSGHATATLDSSGHIKITNDSTGASHSVQVVAAATDAALLTAVGLSSGAAVTGTDATGANDFSGAASGTAAILVRVDGGSTQTVTLGNSSAATATAILTAFNGLTGATAALDATGHLKITSNTKGSDSSIEIVNAGGGSDAALLTALGLTGGNVTNGTNATESNVIQQLNNSIAGDEQLVAAGVQAVDDGGKIKITSSNDTYFRVAATSGGNAGFNNIGLTFTGNAQSAAPAVSPYVDSQGADASATLAYSDTLYGSDSQTINITGSDASGVKHTLSVAIHNNATSREQSIDQVLDKVNTALRQSNDSTLNRILAVKEESGGTQSIRFLSTVRGFQITVSGDPNGTGITPPTGNTSTATTAGSGASSDISTEASANAAVSALAEAVSTLGRAQAVVGRGQNQFNYAINLAQSQLTNLSAAESRIRDADLAQESANLTKSQILLQAGIAALAQANSAPQQVLTLLRG
jgi:flagellin